jgi:hypothetical protein
VGHNAMPTDVSAEIIASIFQVSPRKTTFLVLDYFEHGGTEFIQIIGKSLQIYTAS